MTQFTHMVHHFDHYMHVANTLKTEIPRDILSTLTKGKRKMLGVTALWTFQACMWNDVPKQDKRNHYTTL